MNQKKLRPVNVGSLNLELSENSKLFRFLEDNNSIVCKVN